MCKSCNKKVHLECEVSQDSYTKLQSGEVKCNGCVTPDLILISDSEETLVNSASSPSPIATVPTTLVVNDQLTDQENVLDTHNEELTPKPLFIDYNVNNAYTETTPQVQALNRKPKIGSGRKNKQYRPRMTEQELKEISNRFQVKVKPLFEKRLTASDVGRTGRLVIPKQCAEDYFPSINNSKGECLVILDEDRREWKFNFKFWANTKTRIYFLQGFDDFVKSVELHQGDKVTFSRLECEGKLVIGYRKRPSTSSSSPVDPFHKATTASTYTNRTKKGVFTSTKKNEIPTGNSTSVNREPNAHGNGNYDVGGAKVHFCSKRRKRDIGSTSKSNKNRIKFSEVLAEVRETIRSPHGSNIPSFVVNKNDKENPDELERLGLNTLKAKAPIHSKRFGTYEVGSSCKSSKKVKRSKVKDAREASPEVVVGTLIENVDAFSIHSERNSTFEVGSSSKSTKKVNKRSKVKDARELVVSHEVVEITRGTPIQNGIASSTHSKRKSTYETGSSIKSTKKVDKRSEVKDAQELVALPEAVETQVAPVENVVALPSQPNVNKKHPRHRLDCLCIVCIQPASGSKHQVSCECKACVTLRSRCKKHSQKIPQRARSRRQPVQIESLNTRPPTTPNLAEPGTSNNIHQTISRVSENSGDRNLSSIHSKILPFDLNFPPEDLSEDF